MNPKVLSAALVLCLAAGQAQAYDFVSGGIAYNVLSNTSTRKTAAVTYVTTNPGASGYVSTYKGDVTIPAQTTWNFQTFNVTQVSDLAMFNNQGLYTLHLPEGIISIGSQAFSHCYSLYEISLPSTLSRIADYAFEYCEDLTSITLPARLSMLGDGVFQQCFGLQKIEVPSECVDFKSIDGVLYGGASSDAGLKLLAYPGSRPETEYVMPEEVNSVDGYAFSANRTMRSLTLSKNIATLDWLTFSECENLAEVNVQEGSTTFCGEDGVLFNADRTHLVYYPLQRDAEAYSVPEGVERLEALAFIQTRHLAVLSLPSSLARIGELAFYGAQSFTDVVCHAAVPPVWTASTLVPGATLFDARVYSQATLYVPDDAVEAYRKASGWSSFKKIMPLSAAVDSPVVEDMDAAEYYDLRGRRLEAPAHGITIIRRGNSVNKSLMH